MKSSLTLIERFDIYCRAVLRSETKYYFYKLEALRKLRKWLEESTHEA